MCNRANAGGNPCKAHKTKKNMKTKKDFRSVEELKNHTEQTRKAVAELNKVFTAAKELLNKWNGKKLNKRFATELQAMFAEQFTTTAYSESWTRNYIYIYYGSDWSNKRFNVSLMQYDNNVTNELNATFTFYTPNRYQEGVVDADDRINAENGIKELDNIIARNNELVWRYDDAIAHYDEYDTAFNDALENLYATIRRINPYFVPNEIRTYNAIGIGQKSDWEKMMRAELDK